MLIGHGVECAEYLALLGAEGGFVLAYNDNGSYDEEEEEENKGVALTDPYMISTQSKYDGSSAAKAMICWLNSSTSISDELLEALLEQAEKFQNENALEEEKETAPSSKSSTSDPTETPAEDPTEAPAEDPTEPPTEDPTEEPTEPEESTEAEEPTEPEESSE